MMKYMDLTTRVIVALLFILYGASKFHAFMPTPPMTKSAVMFIGALVSTGYLWPLVGVVEILGGLALLTRRFANLGILLLGPVIVNIVGYLLVLQNGVGAAPIIMSLFLVCGTLFLLYRRKEAWKKLIMS